jgi:ribose transport system permease protein
MNAKVAAQRYALVGAWIVVIVLFCILKPDTFATSANVQNILGSQAVLLVLTLGLILPLTSNDFDLSIASVLTLSAMVLALLNGEQGWPLLPAIIVALGCGLAVGMFNGACVVWLGLDSFIVTLGSGTFVAGVVTWISGSRTVTGMSPVLSDWIINKRLLGVSLVFYYGLALVVLLWYVLTYTAVGRRLLFVGRGRSVARLSGLRVGALRFSALAGSGLLAGLAGVLYAGTTGGADPSSGASFLLPAFAAAYLGATAVSPGRFNAWGAFIAVYFLVTGITGLQLLGVEGFVQELFYGGALVIAVVASTLVKSRSDRQRQSSAEGDLAAAGPPAAAKD